MVSSAQYGLKDEEKEQNFEEAQDFYQRQGGNLITVTGAAMNQFLVDNCQLEYVMFLYFTHKSFYMWYLWHA